jgi:hypothetical protein
MWGNWNGVSVTNMGKKPCVRSGYIYIWIYCYVMWRCIVDINMKWGYNWEYSCNAGFKPPFDAEIMGIELENMGRKRETHFTGWDGSETARIHWTVRICHFPLEKSMGRLGKRGS